MTPTQEEANPVDRFIGPLKVLGTSVVEDATTHGGNEIVKVMYDGGHSETMPRASYEYLVTDKPTDYNELRDKTINAITIELLAVLAEHHFKAEYIQALKASVENELLNSFNRATHYLWTGDDKSFTPGINSVMERSLLDAHTIIKGIDDNGETTESTTEDKAE